MENAKTSAIEPTLLSASSRPCGRLRACFFIHPNWVPESCRGEIGAAKSPAPIERNGFLEKG